MNRKLPVLLVFSVALASLPVLAQETVQVQHVSPTPAWLPRGVFLGASIREGVFTPRLRVQWEAAFFQDRKDAVVAILEGGLGWAASLPTPRQGSPETFIGAYYEHTALAGIGYRNQETPTGVHWGFQVTGGPVFYGAHFEGGASDKRTAGIIDGRIQVGYQAGKFAVGGAVGYAEPFGLKRRSLAHSFVGGPMFGLFLDWR